MDAAIEEVSVTPAEVRAIEREPDLVDRG